METFCSTGMGERSGSNIRSRKLIKGACSRDLSVILIDQPKDVYIDSELETIDTTQWYPQVMRKDFTVGM